MASDTPAQIDLERQQRAREYARIRRCISLINLGIAIIAIALILGFGLDKWLRNSIEGISGGSFLAWQPRADWFPVQILLYFLLLIIIYQVATFPLSYYSGFVLPHRFGLSVMSLKTWIRDLVVAFALSLVL